MIAILAGNVSSQQQQKKAISRIISIVVNTEVQIFHSWPRHQMAYSLGGDSTFTCSDIIKSQTKHSSDGNLILTTT